MKPADRQKLLDLGIDPDFLETYRLAFSTKHGRMPSKAECTEAVRLYAIEAKEKARTHEARKRAKVAKAANQAQMAKDDEQWAKATVTNRTAMVKLQKRADAGDPHAIDDLAFMFALTKAGTPFADLNMGGPVVTITKTGELMVTTLKQVANGGQPAKVTMGELLRLREDYTP